MTTQMDDLDRDWHALFFSSVLLDSGNQKHKYSDTDDDDDDDDDDDTNSEQSEWQFYKTRLEALGLDSAELLNTCMELTSLFSLGFLAICAQKHQRPDSATAAGGGGGRNGLCFVHVPPNTDEQESRRVLRSAIAAIDLFEHAWMNGKDYFGRRNEYLEWCVLNLHYKNMYHRLSERVANLGTV
eukprot:ANDGO_03416.mRNA.1 hypothetical protein